MPKNEVFNTTDWESVIGDLLKYPTTATTATTATTLPKLAELMKVAGLVKAAGLDGAISAASIKGGPVAYDTFESKRAFREYTEKPDYERLDDFRQKYQYLTEGSLPREAKADPASRVELSDTPVTDNPLMGSW